MNGGLSVGVQQIGSVTDDSSVLLECAGKESRYIFEGDDGDIEGVTEPDEASALDGSIDVQAALNKLSCFRELTKDLIRY